MESSLLIGLFQINQLTMEDLSSSSEQSSTPPGSVMPPEVLFHYRRSRRQQARTVALNMLLLPLVFAGLLMLIDEPQAQARFARVLAWITAVAELAMVGAAAWLWTHPAAFELRLTPEALIQHHPQFAVWSFHVAPQDIVAIEPRPARNVGADLQLRLRDGRLLPLCPNFGYSRRRLFAALKALNPALALPRPFA